LVERELSISDSLEAAFGAVLAYGWPKARTEHGRSD
jgi:hypothetical protein